jgi:CBS domain containing-hemolysin-like protein
MNRFIEKPDELISGLLMGNNVALVIYSIAMARILDPLIEKYITQTLGGILAIDTIVATLIVLITAEFMPKALSRLNPNAVFSSLYWVILFFYWLFYPLTAITRGISKTIIKAFGVTNLSEPHKYLFDKSDLMYLSNEVSGAQEEESEHLNDMIIFQNALNFSSVKLRECMVPRTEIAAIDVEDSVDELVKLFVESGYSRIMVYEETVDNIIGYAHSKDLFKHRESTIKEMLRPIDHVSEEMSAQSLMAYLIKNRKPAVVVEDEYGGTAGIVTIEDLFEEIFGEISDELDKEEFIDKKISENEFVFSARLEVDEINRKYNIGLPESDDYETLAGLIIHINEDIPKEQEILQFGAFSFTILKTTKNRIETVSLKILDIE